MADIFENKILCKNCGKVMKPIEIEKNGFLLRAVICERCGAKIIHPADESEYNKFTQLRNKTFMVKMRLVGNSYAVSIPREIVNFIKEQEKIMNDMVKLCFNNGRRLSLMFGESSLCKRDFGEKGKKGEEDEEENEIKEEMEER